MSISRRMHMLFASLTMLLVCSFTVAAQNKVQGVVTDEQGEPLPGVGISVKGTTTGASTNVDGQYSIIAPADGTLTFSYVGMNPEHVKINNRSTINVVLTEDSKNLDEIVVVGYGEQKKVTLTGAVSQVTSKDITKTVGSNLSQSLVGKLPGMITMQSSGRPGSDGVSILVRGYSSYNDAVRCCASSTASNAAATVLPRSTPTKLNLSRCSKMPLHALSTV